MTVKEFVDVFKINDDICIAVNSSDEFVLSVAHGTRAIDPWMMELNISSIEIELCTNYVCLYLYLQGEFDQLLQIQQQWTSADGLNAAI